MIKTVMVTIDSLLDVRMGAVVKNYGKEAAVNLVKNGYLDRLEDKFSKYDPNIDDAFIKRELESKNMDVLKNSILTSVPFMLRDISTVISDYNKNTPFLNTYNVEINLMGYPFSIEEENALIEALKEYVPAHSFTISRIPPEGLTPALIKDRYEFVIMYDFDEWFKHNALLLDEAGMPSVTFIIPAIYHNGIPTEEDLTYNGKRATNGFELFKNLFAMMLTIQFMDAKHFSMFTP